MTCGAVQTPANEGVQAPGSGAGTPATGPSSGAGAAPARDGRAGGPPAPDGGGPTQAERAGHVEEMRRLALQYDVPLLATHAFRSAAQADGLGGGSGDKKRMKAIMKQARPARPRLRTPADRAPTTGGEPVPHPRPACMQVSSLATSLPAHWESSVHVAVDADRFDVLRALILPDRDTPYAYGAFTFDIYFPPTFPSTPPKVGRPSPHTPPLHCSDAVSPAVPALQLHARPRRACMQRPAAPVRMRHLRHARLRACART